MAQKTKTISYIEYVVVRCFIFMVRLLPFSFALKAGRFLGSCVFRIWGRRSEIAQKNLATVFKNKSVKEIEDIAQKVFQNIGQTLIEFVSSKGWDKNELLAHFEKEGLENMEKAFSQGKGIILLTAHFDNWEVLGMALSAMGYKLNVVARPLDNPHLDGVVNQMRSRFGTKVIVNINGIKDMIKALRRNETVGILIDQNLYENAVFVDFFGKTAATTPIIPLLAQKTGAAVIPIHSLRYPGGKHKMIFEKELVMKKCVDRAEFIKENTRLCNQVVERWVWSKPELWFWVHNRWKTQPEKK